MEPIQDHKVMLAQLNEPAFFVQNGVITAVNQRATQYMAEIGTPIESLLISAKEEYAEFQSGCIYLNIRLCGTEHTCRVTRLQDCQLFTVEESTSSSRLQVLALAAQQLCIPLSEISLILDQLSDIPAEQKAKVSQNLYRMQRMIGNMSDAENLSGSDAKLRTYEICSFLEEILEKAKTMLSQNDLQITYSLPAQPVFTLAEPELLKRAIYNLISNAVKFTPSGGSIEISLKQIGNRLHLCITNSGIISTANAGSIFHRYCRQPGLEDPKFGIGLGMTFVHAAATVHGGTILIENCGQQGTKITMTIAIRKNKNSDIRSPILIPDLYGGRDQALIELSDVLSYQLYMD